LDSFTSVENDVRLSASAASSTAEIARRQRISSVTASKGWLPAGRGGCDMGLSKQSFPDWSTFGTPSPSVSNALLTDFRVCGTVKVSYQLKLVGAYSQMHHPHSYF
jgi:hypothetical protein